MCLERKCKYISNHSTDVRKKSRAKCSHDSILFSGIVTTLFGSKLFFNWIIIVNYHINCQWIGHSTARKHIARKHPNQSMSIVKIAGYPGLNQNTFHDYLVMTHAELYKEEPKPVQQAMDLYYEHNCKNRVISFGLTITVCDYACSTVLI